MANSWTNNGFRSLTIPTGAGPGTPRITINENGDGAILLYDANGITASISAFDFLPDGNPAQEVFVGITTYNDVDHNVFNNTIGNENFLGDLTSFPNASDVNIGYQRNTKSQGYRIDSGTADATHTNASLVVVSETTDGAFPSVVQLRQQPAGAGAAATIFGAAVQTDDSTGVRPKFMHAGGYSGTGTGGNVTLSHGCPFTPTVGIMTPLLNFTQGNFVQSFGTNGFTSTQMQVTPILPNGTAVANGVAFAFYAILMA